jgi:hypothetical protein
METNYAWFDPGESTGVCLFDSNYCVVEMCIVRGLGDLYKFLPKLPVRELKHIGCEDYRVFQNRLTAHAGSRVVTIRVLGAIEAFAAQNGIPFIQQPSIVLPIAQKWTRKKLPKNHDLSHDWAAYNHGMYYFIKNGLVKLKARPT